MITGGSVVDFNTNPTGSNTIELVAAGDAGYFAFNERLVSELDLSARRDGGEVFVGAGFFTEDAAEVAQSPSASSRSGRWQTSNPRL